MKTILLATALLVASCAVEATFSDYMVACIDSCRTSLVCDYEEPPGGCAWFCGGEEDFLMSRGQECLEVSIEYRECQSRTFCVLDCEREGRDLERECQ